MITRRQANKLRGRLNYLLELAHEHAHAGAKDPHDAYHLREEYQRVKREVLDQILDLTEDQSK